MNQPGDAVDSTNAPMAVTAAARLTRRRRWPAMLAWALWVLAMLVLAAVAWSDQLLRQAGRPDLVQLTTGTIPPVLAVVSGATVGGVLAGRRPHHPVGWLLLALALSLTATAAAAQYLVHGLLARPAALPAARYAALYQPATAVTALALIGFVLLLTPTGSPPSPRWRWWASGLGAVPMVLLVTVTLAGGPLDPRYQALGGPFDFRGTGRVVLIANQAALAVTTLAVVVAAVSLVGRFRRARGTERQQLRWVAVAAGMVVSAGMVVLAGLTVGVGDTSAVLSWAVGVGLAAVPPAVGAAILRYRLYDLDRIISRAVAYGLVTVLLGGGYAGVVLGLGQLLGRGSSLAVAGATLAVAALFQPVRRRIQQAVDRRFNRRRHDAAKTIQAFSGRLRHQVDLDALTVALLAVADQTMQPTQASLWLRPSAPGSQDQRTTGGSLAG